MIKTLIKGLVEKDMQAVVNTYTLTNLYYPTLFPLKFTPTLTWKAITADIGARVMADVISFDARAPRKSREIVSRANGDIPKIAIGRDKTESEMNEYNQLLVYAQTTDGAQAIMDWIYNDVEFCFNGVNNRLEWLALRAASTGKFVLDENNNAGIVTAVAVDFLVPTANKSGVTVVFSEANVATMKPITVIKNITKAAKAKGFRLNFIFTDESTVDLIMASDEAVKKVASWLMKATDVLAEVSLDTLNQYFAKNSLPQIIIIDSQLTYESLANDRSVLQAWEPGVMLFSANKQLGNTWYSVLADESVQSTTSIKVKRGPVLIKKFANEEPLTESTIAMANAIPSLNGPERLYLVDTLNNTWTH